MAWSAGEKSNSSATTFDVRLRVYAGPLYDTLDLSTFTIGSLPPDWADADTPAAGWTEITTSVAHNGRFTNRRTGNSLCWSCELAGVNYDADLIGMGRAIIALRTLEANGTTGNPVLWFVGQVVAGGSEDDYRHGGKWTRTIRGTDSLLERTNAPRLSAGPIDMAIGAGIMASSTLLTPALEAGTGEFLGSTAIVTPSNAVDQNINSVWISRDAPTSTGETPASNGLVIDKLFIVPLAGYDQTKTWWLEFYNGAAVDMEFGDGIASRWLVNQDDVYFDWKWSGHQEKLKVGERGIICASLADFNAYTGGTRDAAWVVEAKTWPRQGLGAAAGELDGTPFVIDATEGWIKFYGYDVDLVDTVAWNQTGADPSLDEWTGGAIDISSLTAGYVVRRKPSGTDTNTENDWYFDAIAEPGDYAEPGQVEWLIISPAEQDAALAADSAIGAGTLTLSSTIGFTETGDGIVEGDTFSWTGRTTTTLTGVSGLGSTHSTGATVYQTDGGVTQTGWPINKVEIKRRDGLSTIDRMRLYVQKTGATTPKTPDESGWEADWDSNYLSWYSYYNSGDTPIISFYLGGTYGYRWTRRIMVYIQDMSDGGRAKVNEVRMLLSQLAIDNSGVADLANATSATLAEHLLITEYGLAAGSFSDTTPAGHGLLGTHATAIMPYPAVLDDLARVTGCVVQYREDGKVIWLPDPWWPSGASDAQLTPYATLDTAYARGTLRCSDRLPAESAVRVFARTADGENQFERVYPLNYESTDLVRELSGYVVADTLTAYEIAEAEYCRNGLFLNEANSGPASVSLVLTGIGEWMRPDLWVQLIMDIDDQELTTSAGTAPAYVDYLIEQVTYEFGIGPADNRTWKATANMRRFRR